MGGEEVVKIYSREIEEVVYSFPELRFMPYQIVRKKPFPQDKIILRFSYNPKLTKDPEELKKRLEAVLKEKFDVDVEAKIIKPEEVAAMPHKLVKVVDE